MIVRASGNERILITIKIKQDSKSKIVFIDNSKRFFNKIDKFFDEHCCYQNKNEILTSELAHAYFYRLNPDNTKENLKTQAFPLRFKNPNTILKLLLSNIGNLGNKNNYHITITNIKSQERDDKCLFFYEDKGLEEMYDELKTFFEEVIIPNSDTNIVFVGDIKDENSHRIIIKNKDTNKSKTFSISMQYYSSSDILTEMIPFFIKNQRISKNLIKKYNDNKQKGDNLEEEEAN